MIADDFIELKETLLTPEQTFLLRKLIRQTAKSVFETTEGMMYCFTDNSAIIVKSGQASKYKEPKN